MKKILRKILPEWLIGAYHFTKAYIAAAFFRFPSKKMIVIGITGTKGKTSTANFIHSVLSAGGYKAGIITSANIKIGDGDMINKYHMTMPDSFDIQRILAKMVDAHCAFAVVEVTSEGIKQFRHKGIFFDIAVFTNLTPEHLPSHDHRFEIYKREKSKLFGSLAKINKTISGKKIQTEIIVNADSEESGIFLSFKSDKKTTYSIVNQSDLKAEDVTGKNNKVSFKLGKAEYLLNIPGEFNVYNALPAIAIANSYGVTPAKIRDGLSALLSIPGRMERIRPDLDFSVIVDYAHEKQSMSLLLNWARKQAPGDSRVIVLLGAEGGGRDKTKRSQMGKLAGSLADYVIVSNVDPYNDDPTEIIEDIASIAEKEGKKRNIDLFAIEDRRQGIGKALSLAKKDDIVLITGKGAEQSMILANKKIKWDDRLVVREEIDKLLQAKKK